MNQPSLRTPLPDWLVDSLPEDGPAPADVRTEARLRLTDWGLPTLRDEEWRWTNLRPITRGKFTPAGNGASAPEMAEAESLRSSLGDAIVLRFVDGKLVDLPGELPTGLSIRKLADADEAARTAAFAPKQQNANDALLALNTAAATDGLIIDVAANAVIEQPILIQWQDGQTGSDVMSQTRLLVRIGQSAEARLVELVSGPDGQASWRNAVNVFDVADNAKLTHVSVGIGGDARILTARDEARLGRDALLRSINVQLGGKLIRREINTDITGSNSHCDLIGLMMPRDRQLMDTHTRLIHGVPNTTSNEHYRTIADEAGRGVFKGRILVAKDAQKTEAYQSSSNLLLSDDAEIDTKPELEIYADDVKCSHGATIGRLDEEALYYLQSRGISTERARALLIFGFANEVIESVEDESLQAWLSERVQAHLAQRLNLEEPTS